LAGTDHLNQTTAANKPTLQSGAGVLLNGQPVIRFDGTNDFLDTGAWTDLSQPNTVVIVAKSAAASPALLTVNLFDSGVSTAAKRNVLYVLSGGTDNWYLYSGTGPFGFDTTRVADASWHQHLCLFSGAASSHWLDGGTAATGNAGALAMGSLCVGTFSGAGAFFAADISEIVVYDANLSDADKNQVGQYLGTRYGLSYTDI
jgi:hypothetical protein